MSRESVTLRGRAAAEAGMTDTADIKRRTGETTGAGGVITPTWAMLYSGVKCRLQTTVLADQGVTVGEAYRIVKRPEVQLPVSVVGLLEGDVVTFTASALDPDLPGRSYVIRDVLVKSHATARRCTVLEVTS